MSMHPEYIQESIDYLIEQSKKWEWKQSGEFVFIQKVLTTKDDELLVFSYKNCSGVAKDIVKTLIDNKTNKRFKVTEKMTYVITKYLLDNFSLQQITNSFSKI